VALSDHYHPWIDHQGHSPFAWSVAGGVAATTTRLRLGTGVTCPTVRIHPAIIAQAAATAALMMPGRFFLGLGSGENLNEHILGDRWPPPDVRREMLAEAVPLIRQLWQGGLYSHDGRYITVEQARLYSLPEQPPPIYIAASGRRSAELAARLGDGLIAVGASPRVVEVFRASGGAGKPCCAEMNVCWAEDAEEARRTVLRWWPIAAMGGPLTAELRLPAHFEAATASIREEDLADKVVCGPEPARHLDAIRSFREAGFDHVWVHQIGPDQAGFFQFYAREILPAARSL
jgi:G6PDH family F420-dependent oxidoreductase